MSSSRRTDAPARYSSMRLDEHFFRAALTAAIPLDDGSFERHSLEPWHTECDVAGCRGKVAVIVTFALAPASPIALVASSLH